MDESVHIESKPQALARAVAELREVEATRVAGEPPLTLDAFLRLSTHTRERMRLRAERQLKRERDRELRERKKRFNAQRVEITKRYKSTPAGYYTNTLYTKRKFYGELYTLTKDEYVEMVTPFWDRRPFRVRRKDTTKPFGKGNLKIVNPKNCNEVWGEY